VTPLLISSAVGSFDSVTPATVTETGPWGGSPNSANAFTIQINTQFFPTSVCAGHPSCQGWQQFIYSQNQCGGRALCLCAPEKGLRSVVSAGVVARVMPEVASGADDPLQIAGIAVVALNLRDGIDLP